MALDAVTAFRDLVAKFSYEGEGRNLLTNVTFFVGAGFSKAWDKDSPSGWDLFTFSKEFLLSLSTEIDDLLVQPGYPTLDDTAPPRFKELVYNLSMQLKYPGIRTRYMDENSILIAINELKALVQRRFEELAHLNHYNEAQGKFLMPSNPTKEQQNIVRFFKWLRAQQEGSRGYACGLHVDFLSTNYDYLIETILDNASADDILRNTYRGITATQICGRPNENIIQDYWAVTTLLKINGGFEIIPHNGVYQLEYRQRSFEAMKAAPPEIMMPSREQNYTNHYFAAVFPKAVRLLQESRILVLVGYSLSEEDALLRFLIRQFAEDLRDVHSKYIFYIDYMDQDKMTEKLQSCFRYLNRMDANNIFTYSGGFTDWIKNVLEKA